MQALLTNTDLPIKFWEDVVVAHNYIRNCIKAPYLILIPREATKTLEEM
jgi:hypothetical protein